MIVRPLRLFGAAAVVATLATTGCSDDADTPSAAPSSAAPSSATTVAPLTIGTVAVTIAPEAVRLAEDSGVNLAKEVRNAVEHVNELLHLKAPVAGRIVVNAQAAIPEVGVGGRTDPSSGAVLISLSNTGPVPASQALTVWLRQSLAHELDHSKRILDGPGYGTTLGQAIVSEGLADRFSLHAFPSTPPVPWLNALNPDDFNRYATLAQQDAATTETRESHSEWFFGTGDIPRWAGYAIGARWVAEYLAAHPDTDIVAATQLSADELIPQ